MRTYETVLLDMSARPRRWLITGVAGFIGSNLLEQLLMAGQNVVGLDNFSTGNPANLDQVRQAVGEARWGNFRFIEGDIRLLATCHEACAGVDVVLHQAALGSIPRSMDDPVGSNDNNVSGFLNMLVAARDAGIRRFVYASSSSVYGDDPLLPKVEGRIGQPLSPYAVTKYVDELYAVLFGREFGLPTIGLRYFNVFGPRQKPDGAYAAVIPAWISAMLRHEAVYINGDGETVRDFCYVDNAVQANLLAAMIDDDLAWNQVYNIALNGRTSLNQLFDILRRQLAVHDREIQGTAPVYRAFRPGDMRISQADISKAHRLLGYQPACQVPVGLKRTVDWFVKHHQPQAVAEVVSP